MRIDRARFLALALAGCGGGASPPAATPENRVDAVDSGVICATTNGDGSCARWRPERPAEPVCVHFLPSASCAEEEWRRVAPVATADGYRYLEPVSECVDWTEEAVCISRRPRYPVTVQTCADWNDQDGCRAWEDTLPAPAEERSPFS